MPSPYHTADLPAQSLPFHCPKWGAAFQSHHSHCAPQQHHGLWTGWVMQWHRLPTSMLFSQLQVCRDFLGTHGQMQTLPWFVQHIFAKEKAILPLSSPPSLPAKEQQESSPGMHWHKVVAFPKKHPETLKAQQNPRFPPAEGLSAIQLQGKGWESSPIHSF